MRISTDICSTPGGIDIQNKNGESVGERTPLLNGSGKSETIPISSLVVSLHNEAISDLFLSHWEGVTGCSIEEKFASKFDVEDESSFELTTSSEPYGSSSRVHQSKSRRGIAFIAPSKIRRGSLAPLLVEAKKFLPAETGDFLWLVNRFFEETFPKDGKIDLISAFVDEASVYNKIRSFCAKGTYKHHPHFRTFLALADLADQGMNERLLPDLAMELFATVLRGSITKKKFKKDMTIDGNQVFEN